MITTHGAPWSVLQDKDLGWWIPAEMAPLRVALKEAMDRSSAELDAMGRRAVDHAREAYSWSAIASAFDEAIRWVRSGGVPPDHVIGRGAGV